MSDHSDLYASKFLSADQLGGVPRRAVIASADPEVVGQGENASQKLVLSFTKGRARLPLNKTNWLALKSVWGADSDDWIGKTIELRSEKVLFSGKYVDAIRVRAVEPAARSAAPTRAPVAAAPAAPPETPAELPDGRGVADMADDIPW